MDIGCKDIRMPRKNQGFVDFSAKAVYFTYGSGSINELHPDSGINNSYAQEIMSIIK